MTVFKTFLKVLNKYKVPVILYTILLVFFGGFNLSTNDTSTNFVESKPDILIINNDENLGITKNLIEYMERNSNIVDINNNEDAINDAVFYRDVNYVIYIPKNYRVDYLNGLDPAIEIKSTGDYLSSVASMTLNRYLKISNIYRSNDEELMIKEINSTLELETEVIVTSKLDTNQLSKSTFYYNFMNYNILAGSVYVICMVLSSFRLQTVHKRTVISSMDYKKYNRQLLLSNSLLLFVLWIIYVLLSIILIGEVMLSIHGLIYIINSLVFSIVALTLAFLISNLVNNKDAINGIINVVALGSSFLCGAFVPMEFLPNAVVSIAHVLPSYWYIKSNEIIKNLEVINFESLKPIIINMGVMLVFALIFVILANIISNKKRKIG